MSAAGAAILGVIALFFGYLTRVAPLVWVGWALLIVAAVLLVVATSRRDRL